MNKEPKSVSKGTLFCGIPRAWAALHGDEDHPSLFGEVHFYENAFGTLVVSEIYGLPSTADRCRSPVFGFHIHNGNACSGNRENPFADAGTHYDPYGCPHPHHAGDLPPLFEAHGHAFSAFLTDRFCADEVIGKTIIIHSAPDDFTTQPSGNAGKKIACGVIMPHKRR